MWTKAWRVSSLVKATLGGGVSDVRASERLTESTVCIVPPETGLDRQTERILARSGQAGSAGARPRRHAGWANNGGSGCHFLQPRSNPVRSTTLRDLGSAGFPPLARPSFLR